MVCCGQLCARGCRGRTVPDRFGFMLVCCIGAGGLELLSIKWVSLVLPESFAGLGPVMP